MIKKRVFYSITILLIALILYGSLTGCASTKPKELPKTPIKTETTPPPPRENPKITDAKKLLKSGKVKDLERVISLISENNLSKDSKGEEILYLARSFFEILYPMFRDDNTYNKINSIKSEYSGKYYKAMESVKKGKAIPQEELKALSDSKDFFELVIPGFVLLTREDAKLPIGYLEDLNTLSHRAKNTAPQSFIPEYINALVYKKENVKGDEVLSLQNTLRLYPEYYPAKLRLAEILLTNKSADDARKALKLLLEVKKLRKEDTKFLKLLADAYIKNKNYKEASNAIAKAIVLSPSDISLLFLRAKLLEYEGEWEKALKVFNLVLLKDRDNKEAILEKARVLHKLKKYKSALSILYAAEKKYPSEPIFPELRGSILLEESKDEEGLKALNKALKLDPGRISTLRLLLKNAIKMKRWMQGAIYLSRILEKSDAEEDIFLAYTVFKNLGDPEQTLLYAERLYKLGTKEKYSYYYANALHASGKDKEALKLITKELKKVKSHEVKSNLYLLEALIVKKKDKDKALNLLRHALFENPNNFDALLQISYLYISKNELRKASLYLKQAVRLRPNSPGLKIQLKQILDQM